jgi:tRNA(Ile)-lysidine synthase
MVPRLDETEFASLFADLAETGPILIAVSGGPDSTALMHALARWASAPGRPRLVAATVDHGLRPEARAEAESVAVQASALGLAHHILTWSPTPPVSQQRARRARYALLAELAAREGAATLVTGHTLDDQAETILMRATAGSGLSGLGGMRRCVMRGTLRHVRPLLTLPKATLVAACAAGGWAFVDDRFNHDPRYTRARLRGLLPPLAAEGLDAARLARLGARLRRADEALASAAMAALARYRRAPPGAATALDFVGLSQEPAEIGIRVLGLALEQAEAAETDGRLTWPRPSPVRLERLEACFDALQLALTAARPDRRTLAGQRIMLDGQGLVTIMAEPPRRRGRTRVTEIAAGPPHSLGRETQHA